VFNHHTDRVACPGETKTAGRGTVPLRDRTCWPIC